ncbi:MAG: CHAT domain-containing protein [Paludibacteraceae bacterium]|nr:CHAT domain-containing protein [Paludibacteraceae bacterium]
MKRIALFIALIVLTSVVRAESLDPHLKSSLKLIKAHDYKNALAELQAVEYWTPRDSIWFEGIGNYYDFVDYVDSTNSYCRATDSFFIACTYPIEEMSFNFSLLYQDDESALILLRESAHQRKSILGETNLLYGQTLSKIADLLADMNKYDEAESYYLEALNISPHLVRMDRLVELYIEIQEFDKAELYCTKWIEQRNEETGDEGITNSNRSMFEYLANIYSQKGEFVKAEAIYRNILDWFGENDKIFSYDCESLDWVIGDFYLKHSEYIQAAQMYRAAYSIAIHNSQDNTPFEDDLDYNTLTFNEKMGDLYTRAGVYEHAEPLLKQNVEMLKKYYEDNPVAIDLGEAYLQLGLLYLKMQRYEEARYMLDLGTSCSGHWNSAKPLYAVHLYNLAEAYSGLKDYKNAIQCLEKSLDIFESGDVYEETNILNTLNNLCFDYALFGDIKQSQTYCHRLEDAIPQAQTITPIGYASFMDNLAYYYHRWGNDRSKISHYAQEALNTYKKLYIHTLNHLSEEQRGFYWATISFSFNILYPTYAYYHTKRNTNLASLAYNNELFHKGILLSSNDVIKHSILNSNNPELIAQWNKLNDLRARITNTQKSNLNSQDIKQLESQCETLEKQLIKSSAAYRENHRQWNITWDSVRAELQPNQVAIEYMSAPLNKDSTMYCALLLRDTCSYPILIPLFEQKQATSLMSDDEGETYSYDENGASLSSLIWSKVLPYIKPGESVYFAPTGLLHQLAIEALPYDANRTMDDVFNLVRVSSTRELVLNRSSEAHTSATLYGGIQYDMDATDMEVASRQYRGEQLLASRSFGAADINRGHANYLPGTKSEAEQIKKLLTSNRITARLYTDNAANEESFKALSGKHQNVLHIATHGFYWTDSTAQRQKYFTQHNTLMGDGQPTPSAIDPLNRCGLLFAGANIALQGYSNELPEGVQDGILTAKEISLLDLRDANLVVLSACETGKGEITGDGVFGLQRAFKMAGAQTIIMSLWPVNDDATQLLMTEFYRNWITLRQPKREAFRSARNTVRTRYKEPTYWAGFIMLD